MKVDMYRVSFQHAYDAYGFDPGARKNHSCLRRGYWCFENFKENPLDIIAFIKKRMTPKK